MSSLNLQNPAELEHAMHDVFVRYDACLQLWEISGAKTSYSPSEGWMQVVR